MKQKTLAELLLMEYREPEGEDEVPIEPEKLPEEEGEEFVDPEAESTDNKNEEIPAKSKKSSKNHNASPRRSVEDYLERKRLRDEIGSVFEEDETDIEKDLK